MFRDKNGEELKIGDHIIPDEGIELLLTEEKYIEDFNEDCLIGIQVIHPEFFSILTQENLSKQWVKIDEKEYQAISIKAEVKQVSEDCGSEIIATYSEPQIIEPEKTEIDDKDWKEREKISAK